MRARLAALLLLLAWPAAGLFAFGQNKIAYDRFDWKVYETTHFRVHYYMHETELLKKVASFAESGYEELARRFNFQIDDPIPLIVYRTHAEFSQTNVELGFISEGVGAFAEPARNRMVLPADLPDKALHNLILHELTHIFEYQILFQGELRKALTFSPPLWFMEGLASYMAKDEDDRDRMVLRDAVVNDLVPSITERGVGGFLAYRFGHAAFDFIEATWGESGVRDFVFEFRSALGTSTAKALKRAFDIEPDEFDLRFRRWLRKKFVPALVEHGEPIDFGREVRLAGNYGQDLFSVVPSPSGDLAAAFAIVDGRVDVVVFGVEDRKIFRNLTRGRLYGTEYPVVEFVTVGPLTSRDLAWSPNGNEIAWFAREERGRELVVVSALDGKLVRKYDIPPDQPLAPTFTPDGTGVVFRGIVAGQSDIWRIDLAAGTLENLTDDDDYETSPIVSPDGRWLYYSVVDVDPMKIFRMDLSSRSVRQRVTEGKGSDEDASFSADGGKLYYSSSRNDGIYNVFSLDLDTGEIDQWTDAVGGSFTPWVVARPDGDRLLFTGYYRGGFGAYIGKMEKPLKVVREAAKAQFPPGDAEVEPYVPDVEVPVDTAQSKSYKPWPLKIDDAEIFTGITSDQRFYSQALLSWSDTLGDFRGIATFQSVSSYTNYQIALYDLEKRFQKGIQAYWLEDFYVFLENTSQGTQVGRDRIWREAGVKALGDYPFDTFHRLEGSVGYVFRKVDLPLYAGSNEGEGVVIPARSDDYPEVDASFVGDTSEFRSFGPYRGRRYEIGGGWGVDLQGGGGTLYWEGSFDYRQYLPISARTLLATRFYAAASGGGLMSIYSFGGLDTLRGYDYREQIGNRIAYLNLELRFPLVDQIRLPFGVLQQFRGRIFFDVGGAWLEGKDVNPNGVPFQFWDANQHRLVDGLSSWGWGFSWRLGGLDLNWDFAQRWDFKGSLGGRRTSFWIGQKF